LLLSVIVVRDMGAARQEKTFDYQSKSCASGTWLASFGRAASRRFESSGME
jgi:hypothetical protein